MMEKNTLFTTIFFAVVILIVVTVLCLNTGCDSIDKISAVQKNLQEQVSPTLIGTALPSVVRIHDEKGKHLGSGVIFKLFEYPAHNEVVVISCNHVVESSGYKVVGDFFQYNDLGQVSKVKRARLNVLSMDEGSDTVSMVAEIPKGFGSTIHFAKKVELRVGDKLVSISCPAGMTPVVQNGIMSGWYSRGYFATKEGVFSGGLIRGSSGGALFDDDLRFVGLVNSCLAVDKNQRSTGYYDHGIVFFPITSQMLENLSGIRPLSQKELEKIKMASQKPQDRP